MSLIRRQQIQGGDRTFLDLAEHFIGNITASQGGVFNLIGVAVAPGVFGILSGESGSPGIARLQTGSGTTGGGYLLRTPTSITLVNSAWTFTARVRIPTLATVAETFQAQFGFGDQTTSNVGNASAIFFRHSAVSANWQLVTISGGASTVAPSGTPVVAGAWSTFTISMDLAGVLTFGIDGVTTVISTNVPNTASNVMGLIFSISKSVGTLLRVMDVDFVSLRGQL